VISISRYQKFKIFKSDAAPFFFYIEIFPPDPTGFRLEHSKALVDSVKTNPIMPLPMRVDRVFNGEKSILIRPREPITFSIMDDLVATINPEPFLQLGIEKLLNFTEIRAFEKFALSTTLERVNQWWSSTNFLYSKLLRLEEDFSAFVRAYIHTLVKAKMNEEDLLSAAKNYCQMVADVCEKRIKENTILIETTDGEANVKMYKEKMAKYYKKRKKVEELQYHPELVDIDYYNLINGDFSPSKFDLDEIKVSKKKYIPLLFYDDLLECMLQNLNKLEEGEKEILNPSILLDHNVIVVQKSKDFEEVKLEEYSWIRSFADIDFESPIQLIKSTLQDFYSTLNLDAARRF
jgi:hypothetical protein